MGHIMTLFVKMIRRSCHRLRKPPQAPSCQEQIARNF